MVIGFKGRNSHPMFTWIGDSVASVTRPDLTDSNIKSRVIVFNYVRGHPASMAIDDMPTQQSEEVPGCCHQSV